MKGTLVLTVLNRPGVLNRITNLIFKRNLNIHSVIVNQSDKEGIANMTVVLDIDNEFVLKQIIKQINKQVDVINVLEAVI
ncbi:acetolactate synthase small subunit, partial [Bacillus massiliigorillae]|uniref:acetolactate synthase small subunit n=1 Tax=Bacillus massiliigorillae TaxID=1243664 RepID=UPI0003A824D0